MNSPIKPSEKSSRYQKLHLAKRASLNTVPFPIAFSNLDMDIPFEFVVVGTQKGGAYPLYR